MMKFRKKNFLIGFFLLAVFFLAVGVWYAPIVFKGYSTQPVSEDILLARNYHLTGVLATQDDLNITVAASLIKETGRPLVMSQYLRSFFYSKIFDVFGVPPHNNLVLISIILYALVLIIFTILVLYLFNFKTAIIFASIYVFIPFSWSTSKYLGVYEFCLLFWALFFVCYFYGVRNSQQSQNRYAIPAFIISGICLALSGLSKEVTFVFALALFVFLLVKKLRRQLVLIFAPFAIIILLFWLPSVLDGQNRYLSLFTGEGTEESIFSSYLHVFPDPYTYYFEREEFLQEFRNQDLDWSENLETRKTLTNFGFENIKFFDRFKVGSYSLSKHIFRFFSLEYFGGPIITIFLILGFINLRKRYKYIYDLSMYWLGISFLVFSYVILVSRSHLMDFVWLFILTISLGLIYLMDIIRKYFDLQNKKFVLLEVVVFGALLYHFVLVNHVVLGKQYDKDFVPRSMAYSRQIEEFDIKDEEAIAIPGDFPGQDTSLNYFTDKSFVIFRETTLNKLLKEGRVGQALDTFGVKYILGYSDELSDKLATKAGVIIIASKSLEIRIPQISQNRSFLMNLIR